MAIRNDYVRYTGIAIASLRDNPLTHSPLSQDNSICLIAPGAPQFIVTEGASPLMITTESGVPLVTEG